MKLGDLAKDLFEVSFSQSQKIISGLCFDTRVLKSGDIFFAFRGTRQNGNSFIDEAFAKGAVLVICEGDAPQHDNIISVPSVRQVFGMMSARYFGEPSKDFFLLGVTGTNGKTTLTYLFEKFFTPKKSATIGTVLTRIGENFFESSHTTPDAFDLQNFFSRAQQQEISHVGLEVSSHALAQQRVLGCHFDAAIFINLTQDHSDYHADMEDYYSAKKLLFTEHLAKSSKKPKAAIINHDDAYGRRLLAEIKDFGFTILSFGLSPGADVFAKNISFSLNGIAATVCYQGQEAALKTNLFGEHNLQNILAIIAVGLFLQKKLSYLVLCFQNVLIPGRLEKVPVKKPCHVFVDYAHTPDALKNVILALKNVVKKNDQPPRLIVVFGCGGDRDQKKRPVMGAIAAELADVVIVTNDNPRTEDPQQIIAAVENGVKSHMTLFDGRSGYFLQPDRKTALIKALEIASSQDIILVAGKGHENYQIIGTQKIHFDDREILQEI